MYEILCHAVDLLCQGLFTSVFIFLLAKWYDDKQSEKSFRAAAMFVSLELSEHLMILANMVDENRMLQPNSPVGFSSDAWVEFRSSLIGYISIEDMKKAAAYYRSISQTHILSLDCEPYQKYEDVVKDALTNAAYLCDLFEQASRKAKSEASHNFSSRILAEFRRIQASQKKH